MLFDTIDDAELAKLVNDGRELGGSKVQLEDFSYEEYQQMMLSPLSLPRFRDPEVTG